ALDDTSAEAGTITYAAGSHRWPRSPENRGEFHAPPDWLAPLERARPAEEELRLVPLVVRAGGAAFHHFNTFHGSGPNTGSVHRRAVISHLVPAETRFHPEHADPIYSRYRRAGDTTMDESFFPIVWTRDGRRSRWLADLPELAAARPAVPRSQSRQVARSRILFGARRYRRGLSSEQSGPQTDMPGLRSATGSRGGSTGCRL